MRAVSSNGIASARRSSAPRRSSIGVPGSRSISCPRTSEVALPPVRAACPVPVPFSTSISVRRCGQLEAPTSVDDNEPAAVTSPADGIGVADFRCADSGGALLTFSPDARLSAALRHARNARPLRESVERALSFAGVLTIPRDRSFARIVLRCTSRQEFSKRIGYAKMTAESARADATKKYSLSEKIFYHSDRLDLLIFEHEQIALEI